MSEVISFETKVAKEVGVIAACIYWNIKALCDHNRSNHKHIHDGRAWCYDGVQAIQERHDYLSEKQIRTALAKLEDAQYIIAGNFNRSSRDRTKWYADLRVKCILPNGKMEITERENGISQMGKSIKKDTVRDTVRDISSAEGFEEFWEAYAHKRGKEAALKVWKRKNLASKAKDVIAGARAYVKSRGNDAKYWKHPQGWLNDGRWEDHKTTVAASGEIDWPQRLDFFRKGIWLPEWGPSPDYSGCQCPAEFLTEHKRQREEAGA